MLFTRNSVFALLLLMLLPAVHGEEFIFDSDIYEAEQITLDIFITGDIELSGDIRTLQAKLNYYPKQGRSQDIIDETTTPQAITQEESLVYEWSTPRGYQTFSYQARVQSTYDAPEITSAVPYPYRTIPSELTPYLRSEEIIRITPEIQEKAEEIIGTETDAVQAIFNVGRWVKDNIEYDLNSVTADASQPSDWVLEQRYGVCDELTSLFIAMLRSQGIPARFVSGVAYTNLETLDTNWGPHGWAEVWIPGYGWVPYDVTYGQYGAVDATHIAFVRSTDAQNNAVEYSMTSRGGDFQPGPLERDIQIAGRQGSVADKIEISAKPAIENIGFGGANRIDVTVTNTENHYVATELFLARTTQVHTEDYSKSLLLGPQETRSVHWLVTVDELQEGYVYTFPMLVYTNKNHNVSTLFTASSGGVITSTDALELEDEQAGARLSEPITCNAPQEVQAGETVEITCNYPDTARICLKTCSTGTSHTDEYVFDEVGAHTLVATAERSGKSTQRIITIIAQDDPAVSVDIESPRTLPASQTGEIVVELEKTSQAIPTDLTVTIEHPLFKQSWDIESLDGPKLFKLGFLGRQLASGDNTITVRVQGGEIFEEQEILITPQPESFSQRVSLWMNWVWAKLA